MAQGIFFTAPNQLQYEDMPLVFMAGPVQGAPDHQKEVGNIILNKHPLVNVASPRGDYASKNDFDYDAQVDWEEHHLKLARDFGLISFNFVAQSAGLPYEAGRSYAKTSRLEILKVFGWMDYNENLALAVRFDPDYKGENQRYIERELRNRDVPILRGSNREYGEHIVKLLNDEKFLF